MILNIYLYFKSIIIKKINVYFKSIILPQKKSLIKLSQFGFGTRQSGRIMTWDLRVKSIGVKQLPTPRR